MSSLSFSGANSFEVQHAWLERLLVMDMQLSFQGDAVVQSLGELNPP